MEIKALKKEEYAGRKFTVGYRSGGSFDISACEDGFLCPAFTRNRYLKKSVG